MSLSDKFTIIIPPQDIVCNPDCVLRLANGDREAFEWIYKNYSKKIYDYALLLTGNAAESDDIVQDIFLRLWNGRENLRGVQNFNSYLNIMARNFVASFFEKKEKQKFHLKEYRYIADKFVQQKNARTEYWCDNIQILKKGIEKLPSQQKIVYKMRREEGLKRNQIAEQLNISPFTVQNHIQKSLQFLKQYVLDRME